ncbi:MAG: phytanoyl-CoA dioxygenase family protein [Flavobacteriales bacterium]|nr:phytanoyl-CoA dioxygenase family protein [Flavobacteriales bacterium]
MKLFYADQNRLMDNPNIFFKELTEHGFSQVSDLVPPSLIDSLRNEVLKRVDDEADRMGTKEYNDYGRLLFAPVYGGPFLEILELDKLFKLAEPFFDGPSIIYTMTSSCIPPNASNYTNRIHRDSEIRTPHCSLAIQILLDDFTAENGAPLFLKGSHQLLNSPDSDEFENEAILATGKKGDVTFFDSRIWHRSTENHTDKWRCCLLIGLVQPWMKQRFNVETILEETDLSACSQNALKLLGFGSLPPKNWDAFHNNSKSVFK